MEYLINTKELLEDCILIMILQIVQVLKRLYFADEEQVSIIIKIENYLKYLTKIFKHKSIDEELTEDDKNSINRQNQALLNNNVKSVNKYIGLSS